MITQERLKELLEYDPETGIFKWKINRKRVRCGDIAGTICRWPNRREDCRYRQIVITEDNCRIGYRSHRLAWFYHYGEWPHPSVDHVNGDSLDNRICNLRLASGSQNCWNSKRRLDNTTGFKGVSRWKSRFRASIQVFGKQIHLGLFNTAEEAFAAYLKAAEKYHGEFARPA